jgi:hypothetical protein
MLLNSRELTRYDVVATDGPVGVIEDLLFDETDWSVRQIAVNTDGFLVHHNVIISPSNVVEIELPSETLRLNLSTSAVREKSVTATHRQGQGSASDTAAAEHSPSAIVAPLLSVNAMTDYTLHAVDGDVGLVHGLLIDTDTWTIRYLVVDAGKWLEHRFTLLAPRVIHSLNHDDRHFLTNVTRQQVQDSPPYNDDVELSRDWEAFLYDYYGWPKDW